MDYKLERRQHTSGRGHRDFDHHSDVGRYQRDGRNDYPRKSVDLPADGHAWSSQEPNKDSHTFHQSGDNCFSGSGRSHYVHPSSQSHLSVDRDSYGHPRHTDRKSSDRYYHGEPNSSRDRDRYDHPRHRDSQSNSSESYQYRESRSSRDRDSYDHPRHRDSQSKSLESYQCRKSRSSRDRDGYDHSSSQVSHPRHSDSQSKSSNTYQHGRSHSSKGRENHDHSQLSDSHFRNADSYQYRQSSNPDSYRPTSGRQSHNPESAVDKSDGRPLNSSQGFRGRNTPDADISFRHGNLTNASNHAGFKNKHHPSAGQERFHPYKSVGGQRDQESSGSNASHSYPKSKDPYMRQDPAEPNGSHWQLKSRDLSGPNASNPNSQHHAGPNTSHHQPQYPLGTNSSQLPPSWHSAGPNTSQARHPSGPNTSQPQFYTGRNTSQPRYSTGPNISQPRYPAAPDTSQPPPSWHFAERNSSQPQQLCHPEPGGRVWQAPGTSHHVSTRGKADSADIFAASTQATQVSHSSCRPFGSSDDDDDEGDEDDEEEEDDMDDDDDDVNNEEEDIPAKKQPSKKVREKRKKQKGSKDPQDITRVYPLLSFEEYASLWENERNLRLKKLRLMACKACVSPEPRSISKISNARSAECNMKVEHRYDKDLAKKMKVKVVAHLLLDRILAATGSGCETKIEAKRSAFDAALRSLYMPHLRIFTAPDEHRELHASAVPFHQACEQQILKPKRPMAPKVLEHTKFRVMPPRPDNAGKRGRRKFHRKRK